ncbi:hypothetical protein ACFQZ1_09065 [Bacillus sp. CGMCC 1.60114]
MEKKTVLQTKKVTFQEPKLIVKGSLKEMTGGGSGEHRESGVGRFF